MCPHPENPLFERPLEPLSGEKLDVPPMVDEPIEFERAWLMRFLFRKLFYSTMTGYPFSSGPRVAMRLPSFGNDIPPYDRRRRSTVEVQSDPPTPLRPRTSSRRGFPHLGVQAARIRRYFR